MQGWQDLVLTLGEAKGVESVFELRNVRNLLCDFCKLLVDVAELWPRVTRELQPFPVGRAACAPIQLSGLLEGLG